MIKFSKGQIIVTGINLLMFGVINYIGVKSLVKISLETTQSYCNVLARCYNKAISDTVNDKVAIEIVDKAQQNWDAVSKNLNNVNIETLDIDKILENVPNSIQRK